MKVNTAGSVICDTAGGEVCVIVFAWERMSGFLLCQTHYIFSLILHHTVILLFHLDTILSTVMLNIKHVSPTRRILQITKLCSFKVTWILSFSDSVLMDDVCVT